MGNTHSGRVDNYTERVLLGDSLETVLQKTKNRKGRQVVDTWTAEYSIGRESCELGFTKIQHYQGDEATISISDNASTYARDEVEFKMDVSIVEGLLFGNIHLDGPSSMKQLPMCKTLQPQGGVFKSSSFLYGRSYDRTGLIVILRAKNSNNDEELPYMITVKHYFLAASSSHGACVAVKIRSDGDEGGLSFQLQKPVSLHRCQLGPVFDQVRATGWKPNPNGSDFGSGHVDADGGDPSSDYSVTVSGEQHISSLVSTSGSTVGNYNGSMIFHGCQVMLGGTSLPKYGLKNSAWR